MTALPGKPASNSVESAHEQGTAVSPGARLQQVRKERNLEVAEVAERLNLSPGVVRALEADDYRMLPNATFVKGYLRSYARTLEINGDELVRSYEAITGCNQPVKVEPIGAPMISDSRHHARNVALILLALVLAAIALWWGLGSNDVEPVTSVADADALVTGIPAPIATPVVELTPPVVVTTRPTPTDAAIVAEAEAVNEPVEEAAVGSVAAVVEPSPAVAPVEAEPQQPVVPEPVVQQPTSEPPAVPAQAAFPTEPVASTTVAGDYGLVTLKFLGECWVEVRNGSGDLVFSSLKRAGEEVTLRALIPINVKLGNGDVVEVLYNHQAVPFTTRPDRKVVRLNLGE